MSYSKDFSVIIPTWRGAINYLPKLFNSIPQKEGIEIIVVDNSKEPVRREEIVSDRDIVFLHSAPDRHAGGSRNDGMASAKGKWLLFADSDDYFEPGAFDIFYSYLNSDAELIFSKPESIYEDTGEKSDRGDYYARLVHRYSIGELGEQSLRIGFPSPWCKMVSHELVDRYGLRYDEIRAGNDIYFSTTMGFYAGKIAVVDKVTYIVTVNRGSLTQRRDYEVTKARLYSLLRCNKFLKDHGLSSHQHSIMRPLYEARMYGLKQMFELTKMVIRFRQNPFVGVKRWVRTIKKVKEDDKMNKKYIVK